MAAQPGGLAGGVPQRPADAAAAWSLSDRRNRVMWLNNDRVFYAGLLGAVSVRTMGGWLVYVSLGAPLRIALSDVRSGRLAADAPWQSGAVAVVPPYTPHRLASDERLICSVIVEPETVETASLPHWLRDSVGVLPMDGGPAADMLARVRAAHAELLRRPGQPIHWLTDGFDEQLFGQRLPPRRIDGRVAHVLERMRNDPAQHISAQDSAAQAGLSFSRFLHLFKADVGSSFRSLRSWKRARSLLHHVTRDTPLVHVALDTGYPDSTHFSHSIRAVYGLKPRDLFAGSRQLTVLGDSPAAQAAARAEAWR